MAKSKVTTVEEAIKTYCFDGMSVLLPGFVNVGVSEVLIEGLIEAGVKDLSVISNNTSVPHRGIGKLVDADVIKKITCSHIGNNAVTVQKVVDGEIDLTFVPQGSLCEKVRAGGAGIGGQIKQLERKPQIVVATPGRLMDHYNRKTIRLDKIQTVVLDEADRMLDMGFFKDVTRILDKIKNRRNLGLFSATISQEVMTVSWMYQRDEVEITVEPKQEDRPDIDQYSLSCTPLEKAETTLRLIRSQGYERVMIFCNTKHMCQRVSDEFQRAGLDCDCIHGDIRQSQREKTMQRYREGKLPILIATDVASRGIDVEDVDCVINYDIPEENEYYVHRIGRTGRARRKGVAWSLVSNFPEQARLDDICKYCQFTVRPMVLDAEGHLTEAEVKVPTAPSSRRRLR